MRLLKYVLRRPEPTVVAMLEAILARAKAGDVTAVAIVTVGPDGEPGSGFVAELGVTPLLGEIELLKSEILEDVKLRNREGYESEDA